MGDPNKEGARLTVPLLYFNRPSVSGSGKVLKPTWFALIGRARIRTGSTRGGIDW